MKSLTESVVIINIRSILNHVVIYISRCKGSKPALVGWRESVRVVREPFAIRVVRALVLAELNDVIASMMGDLCFIPNECMPNIPNIRVWRLFPCNCT